MKIDLFLLRSRSETVLGEPDRKSKLVVGFDEMVLEVFEVCRLEEQGGEARFQYCLELESDISTSSPSHT